MFTLLYNAFQPDFLEYKVEVLETINKIDKINEINNINKISKINTTDKIDLNEFNNINLINKDLSNDNNVDTNKKVIKKTYLPLTWDFTFLQLFLY